MHRRKLLASSISLITLLWLRRSLAEPVIDAVPPHCLRLRELEEGTRRALDEVLKNGAASAQYLAEIKRVREDTAKRLKGFLEIADAEVTKETIGLVGWCLGSIAGVVAGVAFSGGAVTVGAVALGASIVVDGVTVVIQVISQPQTADEKPWSVMATTIAGRAAFILEQTSNVVLRRVAVATNITLGLYQGYELSKANADAKHLRTELKAILSYLEGMEKDPKFARYVAITAYQEQLKAIGQLEVLAGCALKKAPMGFRLIPKAEQGFRVVP